MSYYGHYSKQPESGIGGLVWFAFIIVFMVGWCSARDKCLHLKCSAGKQPHYLQRDNLCMCVEKPQ